MLQRKYRAAVNQYICTRCCRGYIEGVKRQKTFNKNFAAKVKEKTMANKKIFWLEMPVMILAFGSVLAGCATMNNNYTDERTSTIFPDGTVIWANTIDVLAQNSRLQAEEPDYREKVQKNILMLAAASKEELELLGKKVYKNPDAAANPIYKRHAELLKELPSGSKLVWGGFATQAQLRQEGPIKGGVATVVSFLAEDGSYDHWLIEEPLLGSTD
jgi:hypothetical protein